ncbi:DarT ssDNA thymidine ADP-ribosyltransferase family protein [Mucilaginibacter sp. Mucisp86]|uniref:DarT ssDNA thymidine ADP-ribosyltransferase family protein n=1 Tax=Mucilaginibacter sp. Mucisp86 TaxID=3243060 RepID=UPI0039B5CE35
MAKPPQEGKLLYHLTSLYNVESIFRKGLIARNDLNGFDDVAEPEIIDHREVMDLNGFVPFHFFAGTPFDGAVQNAYSDKDFVFITICRTFAEKNKFRILTQHPLSLVDCSTLPYDQGFNSIQWEIMNQRNYNDRICKEICMAECLSPITVKPSDFFCVFTPNDRVNKEVEKLRNSILGRGAFLVNINEAFFIK